MSDLISRQAFLDFIESVPFLLEHQNFKGIVIDWIKQQPTACNPDKVVEQIEDFFEYCDSIEYCTECKYTQQGKCRTEVIREIVKGGGISE